MRNLIKNLIASTCFCWSSIGIAQIDIDATLKTEINAQIKQANQEIENALLELSKQLNRDLDAAPGLEKKYCKIGADGNDHAQCGSDDTVNAQEKKDVVIDYMTGGWVVSQGHNSSNLVPTDEKLENFQLVNTDSGKLVFKKHLCLEVHFKDSSEMDFAKPFYMNKTVVLCAKDSVQALLINIDHVDDNTVDGTTSMSSIADGNAGWKCFNPDNNLGNGGQAFGYDSDGKRIVDNIDGILNNCITGKSEGL